jgi:hypothetical protein
MNAALLTPSKYIKAAEFLGVDVTYTIAGVKLEELVREDNSKETKGVLSLRETDKGWVINVTNCKCLIAMFGTETDAWIGKRVTLFPEANDNSESGVAIRVRGSPDLEQDVAFTLKLSRKKPRQVVLKALGRRQAPARTGNGRAAGPPSPWSRIKDLADQYGLPTEEIATLIKEATGKTSSGALTEDDVPKCEARFIEAAKEQQEDISFGDPAPQQSQS